MTQILEPVSPVCPERPDLHEVQMGKGQPAFLPLPCHVMHDSTCVVRLQPTEEQRRLIASGADIVLTMQPPIFEPAPMRMYLTGFPPVSVYVGSPEWLAAEPAPAGDQYTLPAPALRISEASTPEACVLEVVPPEGARLGDIDLTVIVASPVADFRDSLMPVRARGVRVRWMLPAEGFQKGVPYYVRAYFAPAEGTQLRPGGYSNTVTVTFPAPPTDPGEEQTPAADGTDATVM
jgi:hypothetical protein